MPSYFEQQLTRLDTATLDSLKQMKRGLEKESLRIDNQGRLSQHPHPIALGAALTHPYITTDYSEALLEFITPAFHSYEEPLEFLHRLHQFTYQNLNAHEQLWVNSMPCAMTQEKEIPLAYYGTSNLGKMKTLYRLGLGHRYGRTMQTIAGIHYNVSFPESFWQMRHQSIAPQMAYQDFVDQNYFALIRNIHRYSGLLVYLFGASPAVCESFFKTPPAHLDRIGTHTLAASQGTSLRMSDLGYQNTVQAQLAINYNSLANYIKTLSTAVDTPYPPFEAIGLKKGEAWQQLNTHVLQIENEYYSVVRPKRTTQTQERPLTALRQRGVEYVELRALDLDPFNPVGINEAQLRFLDLFCCYCLFEESPELTEEEFRRIHHNMRQIAYYGRQPNLTLQQQYNSIEFKTWAETLLSKIALLAASLDAVHQTKAFSQTTQIQQQKIADTDQTPSAKIMRILTTQPSSFFHWAMAQAQQQTNYYAQCAPLTASQNQGLSQWAENSLQYQTQLEMKDRLSFTDFLTHYFNADTPH